MDTLSQRLREAENDNGPQVSNEYDSAGSASGRDLWVALPLELAAECFRLLDLRGCITVSHVSRAWRLAVLDDRSLWNHYRIRQNCGNIEAAVDALSTLLARSHPVPFHFVCDLDEDIPPAISDLVLSNLDRMAELKLNDGPHVAQLMQRDAPLLQRLTCFSRHSEDFVLPAQWGALNAPRLQYLKLWGFIIPRDCQPFRAMRAFNVFLPDGNLDIPLSHVFPDLTRLKLHGVTQDSLPMLSPLPRALETVHLRGFVLDAIDYSHFFQSVCVPCRIRDLQVYSASTFVDALELFVRVYHGPWKLEIGGIHIFLHSIPVGTVLWDIDCYSYISLSHERHFVVHLERLTELELPLVDFVEFERIAHDAWNRRLPDLCALTLLVDTEGDTRSRILRSHDDSPRAGIGMPALEVVEFRCKDSHGAFDYRSWLIRGMPAFLAALLCGQGSPKTLARVLIHTRYSCRLTRPDVAPLLLHAEQVWIRVADDAPLIFERSTAAESTSG